MHRQAKMLDKIEQIEKLIHEIKNELSALSREEGISPKKRKTKDEVIPSQEELKKLYEHFYNDFVENRGDEIRRSIEQKTKRVLAAFCRANNLPIDGSKASKKEIYEEVINWLAQRKAITKEVR